MASRREAKLVSLSQAANLMVLELQTTRTKAERTWREEHRWPAAFSLGLILGRVPEHEARRQKLARWAETSL